MAITFIQKAINNVAGLTTISATLTGAVTAGNFIVVGISSDGGGETLSSVKDQANNSYTITPNSPADNTGRAWIAYLENVPGTSASVTVITATFTGSAVHSIWVREFAGVATSASIDGNVAGTGTGTTVNTPSITPTVTGDLLYAVAFEAANITATGGSWAAADGNIQNGEADEYILSGTTSSQAVNWATTSGSWAAMVAAFKASSGVPPAVRFKNTGTRPRSFAPGLAR